MGTILTVVCDILAKAWESTVNGNLRETCRRSCQGRWEHHRAAWKKSHSNAAQNLFSWYDSSDGQD